MESRPLAKRNHSFLISDILECHNASDAELSSDDAGDIDCDADVGSSVSSNAEGAGASGGRGTGLERGAAGGGGHKCKKPRKARTAFTDQQLAELERSFERAKYLSVQVLHTHSKVDTGPIWYIRVFNCTYILHIHTQSGNACCFPFPA